MILSDAEIRAIQARHPTDNDPTDFAHAIIAATIDKLAAGVSVGTPYIYMEWINPGDRVYRDMFDRDQLNTAIAAAHQAGRKSVHDKCVDVWKDEFLAAARVAALEDAAKVCESEAWRLKSIAVSQQSAATNSKSIGLAVAADKIRALIGAKT